MKEKKKVEEEEEEEEEKEVEEEEKEVEEEVAEEAFEIVVAPNLPISGCSFVTNKGGNLACALYPAGSFNNDNRGFVPK
ncbi:hypothetical protein HZH68_015922 [Vespula germanica]|uniref:Uncharacterized protein n=1 Tax=Vespula germanica TaxID=30212 RepID=A0A834MQ19_VESGE|nr:hypothetical protein HZH68_015922 [Vespula germanica]